MSGKFDLEDFLSQMQQMRKLGPITQLFDMIPGMGKLTQGVDLSNAEQDIKRIEAIIQSMTPEERRNPRLLKASRKRRIARGSGTTVPEVNKLIKQFREMQRMMKQLGRGGRRGRAGMLSRLMGGGPF